MRASSSRPVAFGVPSQGTRSKARLATRLVSFATKASPSVVVPSPSYALPAGLLGIAALSAASDNKILAGISGVLGVFLAIQASRVRFRFESDALEVVIGDEGEDSGENAFVGGKNKWKFDSFTNWEFWWPSFPVLVYFKETQTKPEGQIHFFPIIMNGKELYDVMLERCGSTQNSGQK